MFYKTKNPAQCGIFCFRTFALPFKYILLKNKPPFLKHPAILVLLLLVLAITPGIGWGQVYYHDFGITAITAKPYTGPPTTLDPNLSGSSWTTSAAAFAGFAGNGGGTSACLSINNSSGTPTFTLTFNVATGYQLTVTEIDACRTVHGFNEVAEPKEHPFRCFLGKLWSDRDIRTCGSAGDHHQHLACGGVLQRPIGLLAYARMGRIDYRSGLLLAAATVPGAAVGALTTDYTRAAGSMPSSVS